MNRHLLQEAGYLSLDPELKLALMYLATEADEGGNKARVSIAGTALWAGCTTDEAVRLLYVLETRGLIRLLDEEDGPCYEITIPCDCPDGEGWLK